MAFVAAVFHHFERCGGVEYIEARAEEERRGGRRVERARVASSPSRMMKRGIADVECGRDDAPPPRSQAHRRRKPSARRRSPPPARGLRAPVARRWVPPQLSVASDRSNSRCSIRAPSSSRARGHRCSSSSRRRRGRSARSSSSSSSATTSSPTRRGYRARRRRGPAPVVSFRSSLSRRAVAVTSSPRARCDAQWTVVRAPR